MADSSQRDQRDTDGTDRKEVTRLLHELSAGKVGAGEALLPLVYDELHALAERHMRGERSDHTLQTTALVHEAYLKLGGGQARTWEDRAHFLRIASQAMRRVLIDHARRRGAEKKGGHRQRRPLDEAIALIGEACAPADLLALDQALQKLASIDPHMEQVVELRFFGSLTVEETARVMGISPRTVKADWRIAKAWLKKELGG